MKEEITFLENELEKRKVILNGMEVIGTLLSLGKEGERVELFCKSFKNGVKAPEEMSHLMGYRNLDSGKEDTLTGFIAKHLIEQIYVPLPSNYHGDWKEQYVYTVADKEVLMQTLLGNYFSYYKSIHLEEALPQKVENNTKRKI